VSTTKSDILLDRMMSLHPKLIDLTLDRMWRILDALGHPERALPPVVHIAGTNGKGSTLAMIRAGWRARASASTPTPRPISCASTNASAWRAT
jgi:dihydrofolate synthase/folylpolyglutamate synthase